MRRVSSKLAPAALGPYSQATVLPGGMMFISGQLGVDEEGQLLDGVREQTRQALRNISNIAGGAEVAKVTVLLRSMEDFPVINEEMTVWTENMEVLPARATFAVAGLPLDALVEIEAVAQEEN